MADLSDTQLLEALGVDSARKKKATLTPREERIVAGFEDIQRFVEEHGRLPEHGEGRDIFERLYAIRLNRIQQLEGCRNVLDELDYQGLLGGNVPDSGIDVDYIDDAELLAQLGVEAIANHDVTELRHVKPRVAVRAAEEIASRTQCEDFEEFKPLFQNVQTDLAEGIRKTVPFKDNAEIDKGDLFVLSGQKVYVAELGNEFVTEYDRKDRRLRVIYDNGTESDILLRSLQRALNKDPAGRRITNPSPGPLFTGEPDEADLASGTIYVLRSKSDHTLVAENRKIVHKIGVTGSNIEKRIANAQYDATFLLADVEVVATYELYNINRTKLENLIHRFFAGARLNIHIKDRFGKPVVPREWFFVPLFIIDEVVERIKDGTISRYVYDAENAKLKRRDQVCR